MGHLRRLRGRLRKEASVAGNGDRARPRVLGVGPEARATIQRAVTLFSLLLLAGCTTFLQWVQGPEAFAYRDVPQAYVAPIERAWQDDLAEATRLDARAARLQKAFVMIQVVPTLTCTDARAGSVCNGQTIIRGVQVLVQLNETVMQGRLDYVYRLARHELGHAMFYALWPGMPAAAQHGDPRFVAITGGN